MVYAVVRQLVDRVRAAQADATPLRICGGGTKDFYGESLQGERLEVGSLTGIETYDPAELFVTVRAGTRLSDLEAELASKGQHLAFEPPHFGPEATVGGMIASGLSGPARPHVGSVRDHVLGATLLNGRGEVLRFGGQVMKNVAGYDVSRLLAGSMGTLGVVLDVSLKVMPLPTATLTVLFHFDAASALRYLNEWAGLALPLHASAWLEEGGEGILMLRLSGAKAAVAAAWQRLGGEPVGAEKAARFWCELREQTHGFFAPVTQGQALWRVSVPQAAPMGGLDGRWLIEWGGGQRWLITDRTAADVRAEAKALGGHATLFRRGKEDAPSFTPLDPVLARIHRALKTSFDPAGIFNRGRMFCAY